MRPRVTPGTQPESTPQRGSAPSAIRTDNISSCTVLRQSGQYDSALGLPGSSYDSHNSIECAARAFSECGRQKFGVASFVASQHVPHFVRTLAEQPLLSDGTRLHKAQWHLRGPTSPLSTGPLQIEQLVEPRQRRSVYGKIGHQRPEPVMCLSRHAPTSWRTPEASEKSADG
jgi:hypothetical protein